MPRILELEATIENLPHVISPIEEFLEETSCSQKNIIAISIALEEMYVNIAHYAYENKKGNVKIEYDTLPDRNGVKITLIDSGTPFNPLEKEDPDVTLEASERPIGGLGIYMVKKTMDECVYEYKDGKNCFSMTKCW